MKLRRAAALALFSIFAFVALIICGALWFIATVNGLFWFLPWWLSQFRGLAWNPVDILATFNSVLVVLSLVPWALLCIWTVWKLEGEWLDLLDPNGTPN
jgi:hypothetical protein